MSKFVVIFNESLSFDPLAPIYEFFDRYNEIFHIKDINRKCVVYETHAQNAYLYFFPTLPKNTMIEKIMVTERTYNPSFSVLLSDHPDIEVFNSIKTIYPDSYKEKDDIFEFIGCDFNAKMAIESVDHTSLEIISSKLDINIEERQGVVVEQKFFTNNSLDLESVWFDNFVSNAEDGILEVECALKTTNLTKYERIKEKTISIYASYCFQETDYCISRLFCEIFRLEFVCANYEKRTIYKFSNHGWSVSDGGIHVRRAISVLFPKTLIKTCEKFIELNEVVERVCYTIQNHTFRNKMFNDCCEILYDENFVRNLNSKKHLIRFKNGVYDLIESKLRDGMPNDYITLCAGVEYTVFDENSPETTELIDLLKKIFPVHEVMKYFVRFVSSFLESGNKDKVFSVWSGLGDNGKSIIVKLIEIAFGKYALKLPTSLLMGKRTQSSAATPEIAMIEGKLISFLQEPDESERMNQGFMKELTGNDSIYVRDVFEKGRNIDVKTKFVLIANRMPQLNSVDRAIWSRIKVIPFMSTFVDDPEGKEGYIYKKDPNFSDKLPFLAPVFMHLLTEEYKNYRLFGLEEPEEITKHTEELKKINDTLQQFIDTNTETSNSSVCSLKDLYDSYKMWFREMFPGVKIVNISTFTQDIKKRGFVINNLKQVLGVKITGYL